MDRKCIELTIAIGSWYGISRALVLNIEADICSDDSCNGGRACCRPGDTIDDEWLCVEDTDDRRRLRSSGRYGWYGAGLPDVEIMEILSSSKFFDPRIYAAPYSIVCYLV